MDDAQLAAALRDRADEHGGDALLFTAADRLDLLQSERAALFAAKRAAQAELDAARAEAVALRTDAERWRALPADLLTWVSRDLRRQRAGLVGFLALGEETERAAKLDRWTAAIDAARAAGVKDSLTVGAQREAAR